MFFSTGGGILGANGANEAELSAICNNPNSQCKINQNYKNLTNSGVFSLTNHNAIILGDTNETNGNDAIINTFINYGEILTSYNESIKIEEKGYIGTLINYGTISGHIYIGDANKGAIGTITNYGTMGSIYSTSPPTQSVNITINNLGIMRAHANGSGGGVNNISHLNAPKNVTFTLQNYTIKVDETATEFNNFSGYNGNGDKAAAIRNSHLVVNASGGGSVNFKDKNSKIILDFGNSFELGEKYLISKVATDTGGNPYTALGLDFGRLIPRDLYSLTQSGEYFIAKLNTKGSAIGSLYKSNVRAMNNFDLISNSMIFPYKYGAKRTANKRRVMRKAESSQSPESTNKALESLESNAFFAYKNDNSTNRTRRRITTNRSTQNATQSTQSTNQTTQSTNQTDKYYFLLTPFVTHNYFFESGRYNLSGLEYGFITAFGGKITPSNYLGTHFMMSYGSLGDAKDKDFSITNLNLNAGLHYKLEMIWDMYIKARGDFYYFLNQAKTQFIPNAIKPNNLGFGVSVAYGKNFNFGDGGDLGVEVGIDYKGLQTTRITIDGVDKTTSETYQKSLYNLIYADLGLNYAKYFGGFGINFGVGIKGNVTANKLAKSTIQLSTFNRSVDMILDNDNFLGYANAGIGYLLNAKNFDMEFSLAYYGNFGDRIISNGGGFEWRVVW